MLAIINYTRRTILYVLDMFGGHCSPNNGTFFGVQSENMDLQSEVFRQTIEKKLEFVTKWRHSEIRRLHRRLCANVNVTLSREISPVARRDAIILNTMMSL